MEGRDAVRAQGSWPELEDDLTGGPTYQCRERGETGTPSRLGDAGPRALSGTGPNGSPSAFYSFPESFSFSIFQFLICFIYFTKMLQINSNQILNSSNIQYNV
jgi:hypothetical protein